MFDESDANSLEISPEEVAALLDDPNAAQGLELVDVREGWELVRGVLPGAVHRPMSRLLSSEFPWSAEKRLVVYCEHGVRSLDVVLWLLESKGVQARSMRGGFSEWRGAVGSAAQAEAK